MTSPVPDLFHYAELGTHSGKLIASASQAANRFPRVVKTAHWLSPFAAPQALIETVSNTRRAIATRRAVDVDRAVGAAAYASSVMLESARAAITGAAHSARPVAVAIAKAGGRAVPGLSVAIATADVVWAISVVRDPSASTARKIAAGVSAGASAVAAGASFVPGIGTVGACVASGISVGALILSSFL